MAIYEWSESLQDIYSLLPPLKTNTPGPKDCLLHGGKFKSIYEQLESTLKGTIFPWDKDWKQRLVEDVCCCTPSKRRKTVGGTNLPLTEAEDRQRCTSEEIMNLLNSTNDCPIPKEARDPLTKIVQTQAFRNIPHYHVFLDLVLSHLRLPYRDCLQIKKVSAEVMDRLLGPGQFNMKMQQKKYNAVILHAYDEGTLTVFVAAATHKDFEAIETYIKNEANYDPFWDALFGSDSEDDTNAEEENKTPSSNGTQEDNCCDTCRNVKSKELDKEKIKNLLEMHLPNVKHKESIQLCANPLNKQNRGKRCGKLKAYKHNVRYISEIRVKHTTVTPSNRVKPLISSKKVDISETEWEFLQILLDKRENDPNCYEEFLAKTQQPMVEKVDFSLLKFTRSDTEITENKSCENPANEYSTKLGTTDPKLHEKENFKYRKYVFSNLSSVITLSRKNYYNKVWLTVFLYLALFGLCFTYL